MTVDKYPDHLSHRATDAPLRITLIDGDELTSRGLTSMLREHPGRIELVSLSAPRKDPIDIALYDHAVSGPGGGESTLARLVRDPHIRKVALFTWNFQPWTATDLIRRGASAYLSKALTGRELIEALSAVNRGRVLVSAAATSGPAPKDNLAERGEVLSDREAEMLSLICGGLSNTEIAGALNLSVNTVKSYIRSCYRKIDVDSRSKAVLWGLSHGFGGGTSATASAGPAARILVR